MELGQGNKVLVIGDIMLDQYFYGKVTRISPEAPIPIVKVESQEAVLGGAANVANNISAQGGTVCLIGMVGKDESGDKIRKLLEVRQIESRFLYCSEVKKTNVKERVIGNLQQIVRLDYNDDCRPAAFELQCIFKTIKAILPHYDSVVLSDYGKGMCTTAFCQELISLCLKCQKPVLVDPKGTDWDKYKGATLITPNLKEISQFLSTDLENTDKIIENRCKKICLHLNIQYLVITRSEKGMTMLSSEGRLIHMKTEAREVYDVSGAGDTVIALLALFIEKKTIEEAVKIANTAAGIVVGKKGTSMVSREELEEALELKVEKKIDNKIMSVGKLEKAVKKWRETGETIVFTNGCFDIFHKGHAFSIYSASELGDRLIVAINSDSSVRQLKGNDRPINEEKDRAYVIASLECVDAVVIFNENTPEKLLKKIHPNVLVKSSDYDTKDVIGQEYAERVELVPYVSGYSTTNIIHKMQEAET